MNKYSALGVSAKKSEVHAAIRNLDKGLFPKAFCKILPDLLGNDPEFVNIMHADGAGTKASLAWLYWMETGDLGVWKGIAQDAIAMNIDDVACTGVRGRFLLSSTIGRNKHKVPGEVIKALIEGMQAIGDHLAELGIEIANAGGETADLGDLVKTLVVDSTVMLRGPKSEVVDNALIAAGDVIIGLSSGNDVVSWEGEYNSGIGSNGLTLARHAVLHHSYAEKYPESFDNQLPAELVYAGSCYVTDPLPNTPISVGKALLSPTRFLAHIVYGLRKEFGRHIHGMIHCTGGGQTKILHFVDGLAVYKYQLFDIPPIFQLIQQQGNIDWREMYQVFNMGHRIELYVAPDVAAPILDYCRAVGIRAMQVGSVATADEKLVQLHTAHGTFEYR